MTILNSEVTRLNALEAALTGNITKLGTDFASLKTEIAALQAQSPTVDTTALDAALSQVETTVKSMVAAVEPTNTVGMGMPPGQTGTSTPPATTPAG